MVKPPGQLVQVCSTHRCASTSCLSTSSSTTDLVVRLNLKGEFISRGASRLDAFSGYPVHTIATRQCSWRHNRYTRGMSTPVLSY